MTYEQVNAMSINPPTKSVMVRKLYGSGIYESRKTAATGKAHSVFNTTTCHFFFFGNREKVV